MTDEAELRRKINENLRYVYSGQAARDKERLADERRAQRKQRKTDERRARALRNRIEKLTVERDELQVFLDQELEAAEPSISLDDIDVALDGCVRELNDHIEELKALEEKLNG